MDEDLEREVDLQRKGNETSNEFCINRPREMAKRYAHFIEKNGWPRGSILDVGCRYGDAVEVLSNIFEHSKVQGVDLVPEFIKNAPNCRLGDICNLPFLDHSFDAILCSHVLEHAVDLDKALVEVARVGKGTLYVVVPLQPDKQEFRDQDKSHHTFIPDADEWARRITKSGWREYDRFYAAPAWVEVHFIFLRTRQR
jgi:ubiquinone/menaquinone biosynthesis C-methylase UbiE